VKSRITLYLITLLIGLAAALSLNLLTGLIPTIGSWYSGDLNLALRWQADALMRGRLAISDGPTHHFHDAVWANGLQQPWGIGVPLLRIPFEIAARLFGYRIFPDRLTFLLYVTFAVSFVFHVLVSVGTQIVRNSRSNARVEGWVLPAACLCTATLVLSPGFLTMIRSRFAVYEEVIAYAFLYSLVAFAAMLLFLYRRSGSTLFLLCVLCGFAPFIRPTLIILTVVCIPLAFLSTPREQRRQLSTSFFVGFSAMLILISSWVLSNWIRFESPLEIGQHVYLSNSVVNFQFKVGSPYYLIPWHERLADFLIRLFWFRTQFDPVMFGVQLPLHLVSVGRWAEMYFEPFSPAQLLEIIAASVCIAASLIVRKAKFSDPPMVVATAAAGALIFYASAYGLNHAAVSRYYVDLAAPFAVLTLCGVIAGAEFVGAGLMRITGGRFPDIKPLAILLCCTVYAIIVALRWGTFSLVDRIVPPQREVDILPNAEFPQLSTMNIPDGYRCSAELQRKLLKYNGEGWDQTDCSVAWSTGVFLPITSCVQVIVSSPYRDRAVFERSVTVKANLDPLSLTDFESRESMQRATFCRKQSTSERRIRYIIIGWVAVTDFERLPEPSIFLHSLTAVRESDFFPKPRAEYSPSIPLSGFAVASIFPFSHNLSFAPP
jgi:hypothetical protein